MAEKPLLEPGGVRLDDRVYTHQVALHQITQAHQSALDHTLGASSSHPSSWRRSQSCASSSQCDAEVSTVETMVYVGFSTVMYTTAKSSHLAQIELCSTSKHRPSLGLHRMPRLYPIRA